MVRAKLPRAELVSRLACLFAANGYAGTSLAEITAATGLGKGSLYHAFPGGKEEMAAAVLAATVQEIEAHILIPLESAGDPVAGIARMFEAVQDHYRGGRRICLLGAFALHDTREPFAEAIRSLFLRWRDTLVGSLVRAGVSETHAQGLALETLAVIEGGLVLARANEDPGSFERSLARQNARLAALLHARLRRIA